MSAVPTLAIIAALPREVRGLVGHAAPDPVLKKRGIFLYRLPSAIVVAAGMGAARASLALEAAVHAATITEVISAGLAGACSEGLCAGVAAEASTVIDTGTGERFRTAAEQNHTILVTDDAIAGVQEKARLAATYGAAMVDMEAATLARLAQARGLRFRAIKGISDAHDFELASLARFAGPLGQFRTVAFALHTALRPRQWRMAARLGSDSNKALQALHFRLRAAIAQLS